MQLLRTLALLLSGMIARPGLGWFALWEHLRMRKVKKLFGKLFRDEQGGEVLEYALIAGLIIVGAIALVTAVGGKVVARWTSMDSSI